MIPEVEPGVGGGAVGEVGQKQLETEEDEEARAVPVTIVIPDRSQLSENPETGQSEVVHEMETELRLESTSGNQQGHVEEVNRTSSSDGEVELELTRKEEDNKDLLVAGEVRVPSEEQTSEVMEENGAKQPLSTGEAKGSEVEENVSSEQQLLVQATQSTEEPGLQQVEEELASPETVSSGQVSEQQQQEEEPVGEKVASTENTEEHATPTIALNHVPDVLKVNVLL